MRCRHIHITWGIRNLQQLRAIGLISVEFTHAAGVRKHTNFQGGVLAMWQSLQGKDQFPSQYLVEKKQNLSQFVSNNDNSYRNETRAD